MFLDSEVVVETASGENGEFGGCCVFGSIFSLAANSASLFTWCLSSFPLDVGLQSHCLTKVPSCLPEIVLARSVYDQSLSLTTLLAIPFLDETPVNPSSFSSPRQIENLNTFHDAICSPKAHTKLTALPCMRRFHKDGYVPADSPVMAQGTKWLAKRISLVDGQLWKTDLTGTLKLHVLWFSDHIHLVLRQLHGGLCHRCLPSLYQHFKLRYCTPYASKVIK